MSVDDRELSPFGYKIAMNIGTSNICDDLDDLMAKICGFSKRIDNDRLSLQGAVDSKSICDREGITEGDRMLLTHLNNASMVMGLICADMESIIRKNTKIHEELMRIAMPKHFDRGSQEADLCPPM